MSKMDERHLKFSRPKLLVSNYVFHTRPFTSLRKRLIKSVLINKNHPLCLIYYRTHSSRRRQNMRHMTQFLPPMIHPLSIMALYWEFLMLGVYFAMFLLQVIVCADELKELRYYTLRARFVIDLVFVVDIIKTFFTGYIDDDRRCAVLNPWTVAFNYLKGMFIVDLICSSYCFMVILQSMVFGNGFIECDYSSLLESTVYLRILSIQRWSENMEIFCYYFGIKEAFSKTIVIGWAFVIVTLIVLTALIAFDH